MNLIQPTIKIENNSKIYIYIENMHTFFFAIITK